MRLSRLRQEKTTLAGRGDLAPSSGPEKEAVPPKQKARATRERESDLSGRPFEVVCGRFSLTVHGRFLCGLLLCSFPTNNVVVVFPGFHFLIGGDVVSSGLTQ